MQLKCGICLVHVNECEHGTVIWWFIVWHWFFWCLYAVLLPSRQKPNWKISNEFARIMVAHTKSYAQIRQITSFQTCFQINLSSRIRKKKWYTLKIWLNTFAFRTKWGELACNRMKRKQEIYWTRKISSNTFDSNAQHNYHEANAAIQNAEIFAWFQCLFPCTLPCIQIFKQIWDLWCLQSEKRILREWQWEM